MVQVSIEHEKKANILTKSDDLYEYPCYNNMLGTRRTHNSMHTKLQALCPKRTSNLIIRDTFRGARWF